MSEANNGKSDLPESLGDYGGGMHAKVDTQQTTRLIERAVRERWNIPDAKRPALVKRQMRTVLNPQSTNRDATAAFKTLVAADKQNMEAQRLELEVAGIIGSKDPFTNEPATPIQNNTQINFYLPDNNRGPDAPALEHDSHANGNKRNGRKRKR